MKIFIIVLAVAVAGVIGAYHFGYVSYPFSLTPSPSVSATAQHCGGNIQNAPTCPTGYICQPMPGSHLPFGDVGGACVKVQGPATNSAGILSGHVTIGPICPVEQVGHPCTPSPETYASVKIIVYTSDGKTIVNSVNLDANGNYAIQLEPSDYRVDYQRSGDLYAHKPQLATITPDQTTVLNFNIDTGIR